MTNTRFSSTLFTRTIPALAAAGTLALGVSACGSDDSDSSSSTAAAQTTTQAEAVKPAAEVKDATGGTTAVTLDSDFVAALTSLKVTPGPVGDAKISDKGVASFPITAGMVTYYEPGTMSPFVQGELAHDGSGLSLTAGGKKVELTDFQVDPGASVLTGKVSVNGEVAAESAPLFFLDGRTLKALRVASGGSTAVLEGTTVKLKQEAAELLNTTFGIDDLQPGMVIGVAKISVPTGA